MLTIMDEIALMGSVWRARSRAESARLRSFGISLSQFELIGLARRKGGLSPSEAADLLDWDRPTCTIVAQRCVKEGWLQRRPADNDRRSTRLELSGRGEELLDRIEGRRQLETRGYPPDPLDILDSSERATLRTWLEKVRRRATDLYGPGAWPISAAE